MVPQICRPYGLVLEYAAAVALLLQALTNMHRPCACTVLVAVCGMPSGAYHPRDHGTGTAACRCSATPPRRPRTLLLTPPPLLQILADVAQGLMHMHELDPPLIHRDVKSPNILLTSSLPDARARLADLGCTKVLQMLINSLRHCFPQQFFL